MAEERYWQTRLRHVYPRRAVFRGAAATGAALAGIALAGCGNRKAAPRAGSGTAAGATPRQGGTLNVMTAINPTTLDPQRTTSGPSLDVVSYVMSRLFRFESGLDPNAKDDTDIENDLATGVESPDAVTWTVKLRPDARFQSVPPVNGHAVEAEDIRASFARALDPQNPSRASLNMIDLNQITTPDTTTVQFKLNYPYADFRTLLASSKYSWILPREAAAGAYDPSKQMIGSGPYLLQSLTPDISVDYCLGDARLRHALRLAAVAHAGHLGRLPPQFGLVHEGAPLSRRRPQRGHPRRGPADRPVHGRESRRPRRREVRRPRRGEAQQSEGQDYYGPAAWRPAAALPARHR